MILFGFKTTNPQECFFPNQPTNQRTNKTNPAPSWYLVTDRIPSPVLLVYLPHAIWLKITNPNPATAPNQISLLHPKEEERQIGLETKGGLFLGSPRPLGGTQICFLHLQARFNIQTKGRSWGEASIYIKKIYIYIYMVPPLQKSKIWRNAQNCCKTTGMPVKNKTGRSLGGGYHICIYIYTLEIQPPLNFHFSRNSLSPCQKEPSSSNDGCVRN